MILLTLVVLILILGLLVFVHELGHFLMAKRAGMRVDEFGFGFPPRLFGIRRGETLYSINSIPLGGFVKIAGENGEENGDPRSFSNQGFWARLSVLLAGVVMNFILAWFLIFLGFAVVGTPADVTGITDLGGAHATASHITVVAVEDNSPAAEAGFKPGDVVASVDGQPFTDIGAMIDYTRAHEGQKVVYELKRGRQSFSLDVVPRVNPPAGSGPVGFAPAQIAFLTYPIPQALGVSWSSFLGRTGDILGAFGSLLKQLFASGKLVQGLAGPVGIAVLTKDFTTLGFVYLLQFTAALSINLAIINAFPFPALDGGRVLFLVIEKIRGVQSVKWERIANTVGFLLLLLLMVAVTFHDFGRYQEQLKNLFRGIL